jgi:hypothetical protein
LSVERLESPINPKTSIIIESSEQGRELQLDQTTFALFSASFSDVELTSFNDAWNHPDPKNRELWRTACSKKIKGDGEQECLGDH